MARIGVVYELPFREVKRVVAPDQAWQLPLHVHAGEAMLVLEHDGPVKLANLPQVVALAEKLLRQ